MTHGSLFSGVGGFDLAASWCGWDNVFNCEINKFCRHVLKYYWPDAVQHGNIKTTDFTIYRGRIDALSGGFPCPPVSIAGKRKGTDDPRWLWPEMFRAIREICPGWVVAENVRGLINYKKGVLFEQVCVDLEAAGYKVSSYLLPAASVNAPHRRERIWIVAHRNSTGRWPNTEKKLDESRELLQNWGREKSTNRSFGFMQGGITTHTNSIRLRREDDGKGESKVLIQNYVSDYWQNFPTVSPIHNGDDGIFSGLSANSVLGKREKHRIGKWRKEALMAMGNAVVPQIPYQLFQVIDQISQYELQTRNT